eukprot:GHVN01095484.1.p1 GENE.GHVN01095484.1~~GHVN01095484.1.p1  ORF type:complete len:505 (-),score=77.99 GHVN01095484.1:11-1525(-)
MASYQSGSFWHEPSTNTVNTWRRTQTPLHYHLRRHDYVAFFSELRRGTNPFVRDECGRTALDLALYMIENLIETCLCTSFAVDHLIDSVSYNIQFPGGFVENYRLMYENLYDRPQASVIQSMEARDGETFIQAGTRNQQVCPRYPVVGRNTLPSLPVSGGARTSPLQGQGDGFHETMIMVAEDAMSKPARQKIKTRMNELLQRLQNLHRVVTQLSSNDTLLRLAIDHKIVVTESRREEDEEDDQSAHPFVLDQLRFPYLYMAVLHSLFESFPLTPFGTRWNPQSVCDGRRLINIVVTKKMKGFEILKFLASLPHHIVSFVETLGSQYFHPHAELAQYLLHFAFCMGSPKLFEMVASRADVFSVGDVFDWEEFISTLTTYRKKKTLNRYLAAVAGTRLKNRLHKRLTDTGTDEKRTLPFEERHLTRDVIGTYASLYGESSASQLEQQLEEWEVEPYRREGANRQRQADRAPTDFPTRHSPAAARASAPSSQDLIRYLSKRDDRVK